MPSRASPSRSRGTAEMPPTTVTRGVAEHPPTGVAAPSARYVSPRTAILVVGLLVAGALSLRLADPQRVEWVRTYLVIFGSLLVQALPFVMLGALAASLVEVFVPIGALERLGRLPRPLQLPAAALAGLAFPICECGSVPVARRLAQRGLMPSAAVTFMLAAPVINPVVSRRRSWPIAGGRRRGRWSAAGSCWACWWRSPSAG